jgi:hypothetical protein
MAERHTTQGGGLSVIEMRDAESDGEDHFRIWPVRCGHYVAPPVIAAGVCPACGELDCGAATPPGRGYRCQGL